MKSRKLYYEEVEAKNSNRNLEDIENAKPKPYQVMVEKETEDEKGTVIKITVFEPDSNKWDGTKWTDTTLKAQADGGVNLEQRPPCPAFFQQSIDSMQNQLGELQEQLDYYNALQSKETNKQTATEPTKED